MNADRWRQIEDCYHAAMERPVPERTAFLAQACSGDPELRRAVESLLSHEGQADELPQSPAWNRVTPTDETGTFAPDVLPAGALSPGATMAEYRIAGRLGAGGMCEVYRATETRLQREVAISARITE